MVVPTTTVPGGSGTYTFTATNGGGAATSGTVTVTDTLPVSITPGSATGTGWTCTTSGQAVSCTRADALSPAGSYPALSVPVTFAATASGSVANTATVSGGSEVNTANDTATGTITFAAVSDLTLTMAVPTTTVPGGSGTYTFTATNAGGAATSGTVTVTDTFPVSVTPGSATGTGWTCTTSGQAVSCTRADALSPAGSYPALSVPVTFAATASGSIANTATVSGGSEVNTTDDTATGTITFAAVSDLTLTMVVPTTTVPGGRAGLTRSRRQMAVGQRLQGR